MSKLLELMRANPESAVRLIGIHYYEFLQLIQRVVPHEEIPAAIAHDLAKLPSRPQPWKLLEQLFRGSKLKQIDRGRVQSDQGAIAPPSNPDQPLHLVDQYLLLLYLLHQDSLDEMSLRLRVSQSALLGVYFNVSEASVNQLLSNCTPMIEKLNAFKPLQLNQETVFRKLQSATPYAHDTKLPLRLVQQQGFSPTCIFDIGSSNGSWTRTAHQVFPQAYYHLFEPLASFDNRYQQGLKLTQQKVNCTIHPYALGEAMGTATIAISSDPVGSSLLVEHQSEYFPKFQEIPVKTVDAVIQELSLPYPQLIKLDTQGYELSILKGAVETLKHVEILVIECWLARGYGEKTPLMMELAAWLAQHNFCLYDLGGGYRDASGVLISLNCLFVNSSSQLAQAGQNRVVHLDAVV